MTQEIEDFCKTIGPQSWSRILMFCVHKEIYTVRQFEDLTEVDVIRTRRIGPLTLKRLKSSLTKHGVKLKEFNWEAFP